MLSGSGSLRVDSRTQAYVMPEGILSFGTYSLDWKCVSGRLRIPDSRDSAARLCEILDARAIIKILYFVFLPEPHNIFRLERASYGFHRDYGLHLTEPTGAPCDAGQP